MIFSFTLSLYYRGEFLFSLEKICEGVLVYGKNIICIGIGKILYYKREYLSCTKRCQHGGKQRRVCGGHGTVRKWKTTLLNIVSGFLSADSGKVSVGSVDMLHTDKEKQAEIRSGILGFIFQDFMLIDGLTVQENIFSSTNHRKKACRRYGKKDKRAVVRIWH